MNVPPRTFDRDELVTLAGSEDTAIQVVFAWKLDGGKRFRAMRVQMSGDLPDRFQTRALEAATELRDQRVPRAYDPEWPLGANECFEFVNEPPVGGDLFPQLDAFSGLGWFAMKRRRVPNLYVVVAQLPDKSIASFGSRITAGSVLRSGGLRAIWDDDTFSALDDTVVTFPESFDWIAWRGALMIDNEKGFHAVFRDVPALQTAVVGHVAEITAVVPIVNEAAFIDRCRGNVAMMTKLKRVAENQLYRLPIDRLREYAEEYSIHVQWEADSLVFDGTLDHQWNILKLLDEAGTYGPLSGKKYEVAAKVEI